MLVQAGELVEHCAFADVGIARQGDHPVLRGFLLDDELAVLGIFPCGTDGQAHACTSFCGTGSTACA